jgi:hypothetical protein
MMRDYGTVSPRFWIGVTGKALRGKPEAQIVALYLMTGPHANMIGIFHCPEIYIAHETGLGTEGASKGLARLIEAGFCGYDAPSEVVFVYRMAAYQIGDSLKPGDNRIKGIERELLKASPARFVQRFLEIYGRSFNLQIKPSDIAPSEPLRSQEQEQEQEQDQEQEKEKEPNGSSPDVDESTPEAKYTIPLTGGKQHPVTQDDIDRYRELFPSIDVEQSIRAMLAWIDSNPSKRSGSVRGAKTRMTSWLTRDQDKASRQPRPNGTRPPIADKYANKTYEGTPDDELPASLR